MSPYRVEFRPAAARALRKLDPQTAQRVRGAVALLSQNPRPPGMRPLKGRPGFRVRLGDYRIIYSIEDEVLLIVVVTIGHRREVYRQS
ncbi:MAG: type II toxin-antitoxin system RelE/ParE family toxin [Aeromicrobium sp.]